jgi:antitoxin YefM
VTAEGRHRLYRLEPVRLRPLHQSLAKYESSWPTWTSSGIGMHWYHIQYQYLWRLLVAITASEARKNLFPLIEKVNDDRVPIEITSRRGDAVLLSRADYEALEETAHLLRVPANAKRLIESLQQARSDQREEHDLAR